MTPFATNVIHLLGTATLVADIIIVLYAIGIFIPAFRATALFKMIGEKAVFLGFLVSLIASLGTYVFSQVIGFVPCEFCWYQRIFMFPQPIILGMALWKKDERVVDYSIVLSVIGSLIAIYHYYGQNFNSNALPCAAEAVSCAKREFIEYGYITIPMMALTAFLSIILIMVTRKITSKQN